MLHEFWSFIRWYWKDSLKDLVANAIALLWFFSLTYLLAKAVFPMLYHILGEDRGLSIGFSLATGCVLAIAGLMLLITVLEKISDWRRDKENGRWQ